MNKYAVHAPIGAAGNHLRWLMLLDPKFSTKIASADKTVLETTRWNTSLETLPNHLVCPFDTIENKINFIENHVYHADRSWSIWLSTEWRFRKQLNLSIRFEHDYNFISAKDKTVALTIEPELAYRHYVKFNCNLNNFSKKLFMDSIDNNNYYFNQRKDDPMVLVLDATLLFDPILDRNMYNSIIKFCDFDNQYDVAQTIHNLWFNLNQKSEIDIVNDFQQLYSNH